MVMKVFMGGSRQISRLNNNIGQYLDDILKKGPTVLIGDANGSDKAIQQYLHDKKYQEVLVYCSGVHCRNNLGNWEVRIVHSGRSSKDFAFYTAKDRQMSIEADIGLMLWDGKSKGTLNNILNLLENGKKSSVYFSPKKLLIGLASIRDLLMRPSKSARIIFRTNGIFTGKTGDYCGHATHYLVVGSVTHLLKYCDRASLDYFEKSLRLNDRLHSDHSQLSLV